MDVGIKGCGQMTTLHLLAIAGYFLCLYEFIAMRHQEICAESNARINFENRQRTFKAAYGTLREWNEAMDAQELYWNRGMK